MFFCVFLYTLSNNRHVYIYIHTVENMIPATGRGVACLCVGAFLALYKSPILTRSKAWYPRSRCIQINLNQHFKH